jgi:hypothetical protein
VRAAAERMMGRIDTAGGGTTFRERMAVWPEEHGRAIDPENGSWIMVIKPPYTDVPVEPLSIFHATVELHGAALKKFPGYRKQLARILTPDGTLCLYPDEYVLVRDPADLLGREDEGIYPHLQDGRDPLDADALFYLMSRGIDRHEASVILLGDLLADAHIWFSADPRNWPLVGIDPPEEAL